MTRLSSLLSTLSSYSPSIEKCTDLPNSDDVNLEQVAEEIDTLSVRHPDYSRLAGRVLAKSMDEVLAGMTFTERMESIHSLPYRDSSTSRRLSSEFLAFIKKYRTELNSAMKYERNYSYTYIALCTVRKVYLGEHEGVILETAQDWHMRVAVQLALGLTGRDKKRELAFCLEEYEDLSLGKKVYATPICRNAGYADCQLSSCFLLHVPDNIEGIYKTLGDCAKIHASFGGCAISMHDVRAMGSKVKSTGGSAAGLLAFAGEFDNTSSIVQSGGRRSGSNTLWLEPHHFDILDILTARTLRGDNTKLRHLFQGLMLSDLFMKRVESNEMWTLFDPAKYPNLASLSNEAFERQYLAYEKRALVLLHTKGKKTIHAASGIELLSVKSNCARIRAIELWNAIKTQISDNSSPFLIAKDAVNRSNQQSNRGEVEMSNLCNEILQVVNKDESAVCTLGNLALVEFVKKGESGPYFDYEELHACTKRMCTGLNSVIDRQVLPTKRASLSSKTMRAIGIGVQAFANALIALNVPFDSNEGREVNRRVAETLYHAALDASCELAEDTQPYHHFKTNGGSYLAQGLFHWEKDGKYPHELYWDWESLRARIMLFGVANSLVTAYAPTATTSIVLGNEESIQPITSNIVQRSTLAGDFSVIQPNLCRELERLGKWSYRTRDEIIKCGGRVTTLDIPTSVKAIYKTAYEVSSKCVIDMARDRQYFIDQGQSMNLFVPASQRNFSAFLDTAIFYAWKKGNKNLLYYCRQEKEVEALNVNLRESELVPVVTEEKKEEEAQVCRREPGCTFCE